MPVITRLWSKTFNSVKTNKIEGKDETMPIRTRLWYKTANNIKTNKEEDKEETKPVLKNKRLTRYTCQYSGCNASYDRIFRFNRHIRSHTGERPYKCDHPGCDKSYIAYSHLKRHAETHNCIQKGLQCNQCHIIVSNYHNLKRHHKRVHDNPLRCKECSAQFRKKHHLALHMNEHLGVTTYKCSQCNKSFVNMRKLKRHEGFHEGKGYRCPISECSEVFDKWSLLRKHKVQHNVFQCKICGKEFKRNATLRVHLKTHTEPNFLFCPYDTCSRKYRTKSALTFHIKTRHFNQKFICDICKNTFVAKHSLRNHIMLIHMGLEINRPRKPKKSVRKKRKDAGVPRKSMITEITGLKFAHHIDKKLLERESAIKFTT